MLHRLCRPPSIPLSFGLATVLPRRSVSRVSWAPDPRRPRANTHRLRHGLPGYLILFATHAFEPQRQLQTREPPSPLVFFHISTHSTATHGVPLSSLALKLSSFRCPSPVKPKAFTSDLKDRLRSLYAQ